MCNCASRAHCLSSIEFKSFTTFPCVLEAATHSWAQSDVDKLRREKALHILLKALETLQLALCTLALYSTRGHRGADVEAASLSRYAIYSYWSRLRHSDSCWWKLLNCSENHKFSSLSRYNFWEKSKFSQKSFLLFKKKSYTIIK